MGDRVWLHSPTVPRGRSPKLHQPRTGPFVVVKVLSDVTYRVQSEKLKPGRHRQRFVVHFNHLKPCQTPIQETQQEGEPNEVNGEQGNIFNNEEDAMTLIWHPTTQESEVQLREPAERGGPTWGGRLRRSTRPPDYYASNIDLYLQPLAHTRPYEL